MANIIEEWKETASHLGEIYTGASLIVDDYIYEFSDAFSSYSAINSNGTLEQWKYTYTAPPSVTEENYTNSAVSWNEYIYYSNNNAIYYTIKNSNGELEPWIKLCDLPDILNNHMMFIFDKYIYIVGGYNEEPAMNNITYRYTIMPNGTFEGTPDELTGYKKFGAGTIVSPNNFIYIVGGYNEANENTSTCQKCQILPNGDLGEWEETTPFSATNELEIFTLPIITKGNHIIVSTVDDVEQKFTKRTTILSNNELDEWVDDLRYPYQHGFVAYHKGYIYLFYGINEGSGTAENTYYSLILNDISEGDDVGISKGGSGWSDKEDILEKKIKRMPVGKVRKINYSKNYIGNPLKNPFSPFKKRGVKYGR